MNALGSHRTKIRRVLVSIPTAQHAERQKLEGILQYAHGKSNGRWDVVLDLGDAPPPDIDGIIAYVVSDKHRKAILALRKPTVLIEDLFEPKSFPRRKNVVTLLCDHVAEGRTAARYFLERHYRHFAFVGAKGAWSDARGRGFEQTLRQSRFSCLRIAPGDIARLKRPCAVFATHDILARRVLAFAEQLGLSVPDELAVLGVDNDEVMCTTSAPALSSIPTFDISLGHTAGRALNELIAGTSAGRVIRTRHAKVITRASTDADAVEDPFVARALTWIRNHLAEDLRAETLARHVNYSRSALQLHFEKALGASIGTTVRQLRLSAAVDLLVNGTKPIANIAQDCGYVSPSHLSAHMVRVYGMTPLAYRKSFDVKGETGRPGRCAPPNDRASYGKVLTA